MRLLSFILFFVFIYPLIKIRLKFRGFNQAWVIGGHAGKIYADNSAALHDYIVHNTKQPVIWITKNKKLFQRLKEKGVPVCLRDTLRSRFHILLAPVLIRSHGYADLDSYIGRKLRPHGLRIHLNHCLNLLKAGQLFNPLVENMSAREKNKEIKKITKFDYLLASSPLEQKNFRLSMPFAYEKIILGGGAHLDQLRSPSDQKLILYFPTWRDKIIRANTTVQDVISSLVTNPQLVDWLKSTGYKLVVCNHINIKSVPELENLPPEIELVGPESVQSVLLNCSALISDYSGLILDALYLDKQVIFYPFDLEDYLKVRSLYMDYDEVCFGPRVSSINELITLLKHDTWKDLGPFEYKRKTLYEKMFPEGKGGYAKRSYETVAEILSQKSTK